MKYNCKQINEIDREYFMLREELMYFQKAKYEYERNMLLAVPIILSFIWTTDNIYAFLTPIFLIIPVFLACESYKNQIAKIAAYMNVFYKIDYLYWEQRLILFYNHHYVKYKNKNNILGLSPVYVVPLLGTCMLAVAKLKIDISQIINFNIPNSIFLILLAIIFSFIYMIIKTEDINTKKEKLILDWEIIFKEEKNEKMQYNLDRGIFDE